MRVEILLLFDWISSLFISFVLLISSIVIFYRKSYMSHEKYPSRFILLVVIFVLSIILIVLSPNLISILLGWDGLGLVSYCLVIYYQNVKSYNAGMLTALSNRVGDVILLISIAWIVNFGRWNFILYLEYFLLDRSLNYVGLIVLIAAFTKSAQVPFSAWLPAAIAAPTPVSALVHSSTLVTAGVYLLIRFHCLIINFSLILLFIGLITIFMSGLGANFEYDLKKIIALSTLSQLGLIIITLSLGRVELAFFHLLTHALFKALLFICAGNFIHLIRECQDIRYMGGLIFKVPLTIVYFNIRNFSLCGIPFFSGFYSKDLIIEFFSMGRLNLFVYILMFISLGFTVSYRIRLIYYLIYSEVHFFSLNTIKENFDYIIYRIGIIFIFVIFSGRMLMWLLFNNPYLILLPLFMKLLTLIIVLIGVLIGLEISQLTLIYNIIMINNSKILLFISNIWNIPYIFTLGINYFIIKSGKLNVKFMDQGWSEFLGSQGLFNYLKQSSMLIQYLFKNNLKIYLIIFLGWIFILLLMNLYLNSL